MAPDMLTIPIMPESRLKATVQTTALMHAIASAACFVFRDQLPHILGFPSSLFSLGLGFALAFHATFLFRVSIKEPLQTSLISASAFIHVLSSIFIAVVVLFFRLFPYKFPQGFIIWSTAASLQSLGGGALLFFSHYSSHPYSSTEAISL